jgi:HEAT repeat protein
MKGYFALHEENTEADKPFTLNAHVRERLESGKSLLQMVDFDARSSAALSLGRIGDSRAIESLIARLYKEKEDEVKDSIIEALKAFNNDMANAELEIYLDSITPPHLKDVIKTFKAYDKSKPIADFTQYLNDENEEVRRYACACFCELKDERAIDALTQSLYHDTVKIIGIVNKW